MCELGKCSICNSALVDKEPSYIPLGVDTVLEIIDQTCPKCGGSVVGKNQKKRTIKNKELHDKLYKHMRELLHC